MLRFALAASRPRLATLKLANVGLIIRFFDFHHLVDENLPFHKELVRGGYLYV